MTLTGTLIITRHHESEWNKKGVWTGSRDVHLSHYGKEKAAEMGALIKDYKPDYAFISSQVRTDETLMAMLGTLGITSLSGEGNPALNERDYGIYTGKNKWEVESLIGKEEFEKLRRNWDYPVPQGETLKMVYERVVPFYLNTILPHIVEGEIVLVVSHGNTLRALTMYLESILPEHAQEVEMLFGAVIRYKVNETGKMVSKDAKRVTSDVPA